MPRCTFVRTGESQHTPVGRSILNVTKHRRRDVLLRMQFHHFLATPLRWNEHIFNALTGALTAVTPSSRALPSHAFTTMFRRIQANHIFALFVVVVHCSAALRMVCDRAVHARQGTYTYSSGWAIEFPHKSASMRLQYAISSRIECGRMRKRDTHHSDGLFSELKSENTNGKN